MRRALQRATGFKDYEWQLIRGPSSPPVMQMAMDQVLAEEVGAGRRKPTLRIWEWNSPAVVIGSFQSVKNEVDPENAAKYGFDVVRRISRRRRDVHGGRLGHHLLDLRAGRAGAAA